MFLIYSVYREDKVSKVLYFYCVPDRLGSDFYSQLEMASNF